MKKQFYLTLVLLVVMMLAISGCVVQAPPSQAPAAPQEAAPAEEAAESTGGQAFEGVTVVVVGVSGDQGEFLKTAAADWEAETGATVELNLIPFGELQDKVMAALTADTFIGDVLNVPAYMAGDLMGGGYIEPVPDQLKAQMEWDDVLPLYRQQAEWGGTNYGYPWDGDFHSMYYRKDLIADPDNQAAFNERYGYDLRAPQTWQEYHDVAEFFTGEWNGDGRQHYGSVELVMRKNQGFHGFMSRATCYAKMPDNPAVLFDPDTMDAWINHPGFVQALQDLVDILPYSPPDMANYGFIENAQAFVGGLVALDIQWADIGPMSVDPNMSVVQGLVGFDLTPGCTRTWDSAAGEWVEFPGINYAPYAAFGGWQNLVPANARAKEAAMDLAAFYASPDIMKLASLTSGSGVNPARYSTVEDTQAWVEAGFPSEEDARQYLDAIRRLLEHPNAVFQLRLPGYVQYQDALELAVSKAMAGQASPQEALDEAAAEWDSITDRIGRDNQRALYRQSIGLE